MPLEAETTTKLHLDIAFPTYDQAGGPFLCSLFIFGNLRDGREEGQIVLLSRREHRAVYHPSYDLYTGKTGEDIKDVRGGPAIFAVESFFKAGPAGTLPRGAALLEKTFRERGERLWLMSPTTFAELGRRMAWDHDFGRSVLRQVLLFTSIKRTARTETRLPDRTSCYPGQNMPTLDITTEELNFGKHDQEAISALCDNPGTNPRSRTST